MKSLIINREQTTRKRSYDKMAENKEEEVKERRGPDEIPKKRRGLRQEKEFCRLGTNRSAISDLNSSRVLRHR